MPVTMVDVTQTPKADGSAPSGGASSNGTDSKGGSSATTSGAPAAPKGSRPQAAGSARSIPVASHHNPDSLASMIKSIACITLVSAILLAYGVRCSLRNRDWESEESLFRQAGAVCVASAKVQLNLGILMRRKFNWGMALSHFRAARAIEPSYCEPTYWYGLTLINQGQHMDLGIQELEKSIACKYVATDAVQALNTIYKVLTHPPTSCLLAPAGKTMGTFLGTGALLCCCSHCSISAPILIKMGQPQGLVRRALLMGCSAKLSISHMKKRPLS